MMMKGQAFSTFQLMIAAVVAIAILGILLGIISGISPQVSSPRHAITNVLREAASSPGIVKSSAQRARFTQGDMYPGDVFTEVVGGRTVKFACGGITGCNVTKDGSLSVESTFDAKLYATCEETECCVGIGKPVKSTKDCTSQSTS